jgi:3-oxoacyl-[acyl-carrier protein] reductase
MDMTFERSEYFRDKVVWVTGSGRGIGRAFAELFAARGCAVAVHGRREEGPAEYGEGSTLSQTARDIAEAFGVETLCVRADLTQPDQVEAAAGEIEARLGPIDVLVQNAGGDIAARGGKPDPNEAIDIKEEDVRAVLGSNLLATIFTCQRVARSMRARRGGRIITVSSVASFIGRENGAIYATAKAGVNHYTRCLAAQLRPHNVTVNGIAPGDTRTARFLRTREVDPKRMVEGETLDRIALVDEVARVAEFFAGPEGEFVSGQILRVDGGGQCWPG